MDIDARDIDAAAPAVARQLAVLQSALAAGPLLFLGVVLGLHAAGRGGQQPPDLALLDLLSLVHGLLALSILPLSLFLVPRGLTSPRRMQALATRTQGDSAAAARALLAAVGNARIAQLGLLEGAALLGIVVCLLAVLQGAVTEHPVYWLNAATAGVLLAISVATFPTAPRLAGLARRQMQR